MNQIKDIIVCPKCKCHLTDTLECPSCHQKYDYKHHVFNIISPELSGDTTSYWKITDEMLENPDAFLKKLAEETDFRKEYESKKSKETLKAEEKLHQYTNSVISTLSGTVCDLATGMGKMLQRLLDSPNKNFSIVCTDIDPNALAWTRKVKQTDDSRISYAASDGQHLSFANNSFDCISSDSGLGNIPDCDAVLRELFRVLKPGGKLMIEGGYVEKGSKSFEIAKQYGLENAVIEEYLLESLERAGFQDIQSTVTSEAVWAENPYDLIPVTGDVMRYVLIQAVKR